MRREILENMMQLWRQWFGVMLGCVLWTGTVGCGHDTTTNPIHASAQYWALTLNAHAATLSTAASYNTIRLNAIPRDGTGAALPTAGLPSAQFTVADGRGAVTVDTTGLVTAHLATLGTPTVIRVRRTVDGITHTDSIRIQVTDVVPTSPLATLTVSLPPTTGSFYPSGMVVDPIVVTAIDAFGAPMPDALIDLESSKPEVAGLSVGGRLETFQPGVTILRASTTTYGVTKQISVDLKVGLPKDGNFWVVFRTPVGSTTPEPRFTPNTLTLSKGAVVRWSNGDGAAYHTQPIDVVFDDSVHAEAVPDSLNPYGFIKDVYPTLDLFQSGNMTILPRNFESIPPQVGDSYRYFTRAGTYHFHSRLHPTATGTLIIQ